MTATATATVEVDPRLRARRVAVARSAGRRRLWKVLAVLGVAALGLAAYGISRSPLLDVDRVVVRDPGVRLTEAEITEAAAIPAGTAMTDLDAAAVELRIEELAWVAEARVRRDWPASVVIEVDERVPVAAALAPGGGWVLVDADGLVLAPASAPPPELLALSGIHAAGDVGSRLATDAADLLWLGRLLPPELVPELRGAWRHQGQLYLGLRTGERILLGDAAALATKVTAVTTMLDELADRDAWELDVSVPTAPVVRQLVPLAP